MLSTKKKGYFMTLLKLMLLRCDLSCGFERVCEFFDNIINGILEVGFIL